MKPVDHQTPIVKTLTWRNEQATQQFALMLAKRPAIKNTFIALQGELGAGKTTLVRHLLSALGVTGRIKSPTYAVVESYALPELTVWHFDFYRFSDPREWEDAGFRDIFSSLGLKLAEWPENVATVMPTADIAIKIEATLDDSRLVTLTSQTPLGAAIITGLSS